MFLVRRVAAVLGTAAVVLALAAPASAQSVVVIEDFRIDNVPARIRRVGDLWSPLLAPHGRVRLQRFLS